MICRSGRPPRSVFHCLKLRNSHPTSNRYQVRKVGLPPRCLPTFQTLPNDSQVGKVALAPLCLSLPQTAKSPPDIKQISDPEGGLAPALSLNFSNSPECFAGRVFFLVTLAPLRPGCASGAVDGNPHPGLEMSKDHGYIKEGAGTPEHVRQIVPPSFSTIQVEFCKIEGCAFRRPFPL